MHRVQAEDPAVGWEDVMIKQASMHDNSVLFDCEMGKSRKIRQVQIDWYSPIVFRVQLFAHNNPPDGTIEISKPWTVAAVHVEKMKSGYSVHSSSLALEVTQNPLQICVRNLKRKIISKQVISISENDAEPAVRVSANLEMSEKLFGLGARHDALNKKGTQSTIWVGDTASGLDTETRAPVPFFFSTRSYGIFVNSALKSIFDLGKSDWEMVCDRSFCRFGLLREPVPDVLSDYTQLVGRPSLPR